MSDDEEEKWSARDEWISGIVSLRRGAQLVIQRPGGERSGERISRREWLSQENENATQYDAIYSYQFSGIKHSGVLKCTMHCNKCHKSTHHDKI